MAHEPQPPDIHLPRPTMWPFVMAGGITLLMFGVLTEWVFSMVGFVLIALALGGWIREMRRE